MLGLKVQATTTWSHRGQSTSTPWSHRGQYASASQALGLKMCTTTPNSSFSFLLTLRTLTFSLHIYTVNHLEVFFKFESYFYYISLFFWPHESLIYQAISVGLKLWLWQLDPAHYLAFQPHGWGTSQSCVHCHNSMAFQGACQQAAAFCSQTTLSRTACLKESEFALAGQPRKPAF